MPDTSTLPSAGAVTSANGQSAPHARRRRGMIGVHLVLILGTVLMVGPFVIEVLTSLKTFNETIAVPPTLFPSSPQWHNYVDVFTPTFPLGRQLLNTALAATARIAGQLFFCSLAAYVFARLDFPGRKVLFGLFLSVLMVPSQLFLVPQYQIMQSLGWLDTLQALFVPGIFSAFGVFLLRQFFLTLPIELDEAARLDGCNPFQIFWKILLPLIRPALVALALLTLVSSWNDLLWPLVVNTSANQLPVSAGLATLRGQYELQFQLIMTGAIITTAPIIIIFAVLQRQFITGVASSGLK